MPEDLIRFWLGHADKSVTDGYSKIKDDVAYRRIAAEEVGLGFKLPTENRAENNDVVPTCTLRELVADVA